MSEAIRLATGLSRADGGEPKWNFWRRIRSNFESDSDWVAARAMHESRSEEHEAHNELALFNALRKACSRLWSSLKVELLEKNESDRFFRVEVPSAQVFYSRQLHGIAIDANAVGKCLRQIAPARTSLIA
jgi:hypothetical protein